MLTKYLSNRIGKAVVFYLLCAPLYAEEDKFADLEVSGFARLVAGVLDDNHAAYEGYDNSLSFSERSLLGLQMDARLSAHWSVTGQAVAHSSDVQESGVEWLYLSYHPSNALQIKMGKLRTPFFAYSDVIHVGYAYHFISPPQQVYSPYFFDSFDGISANYNISQTTFATELDVYYGKFSDDIHYDILRIDTEINAFRGIALSLSKDNFKFRMSAHTGDGNLNIPMISEVYDMLKQTNYVASAQSLATTGQLNTYQLSLNYDAIDYFVRSEIIRLTTPIALYPKITSYYLSYGYVCYPFTLHMTYANSMTSKASPVIEIPHGLSAKTDTLASTYLQIFDTLTEDDLESLSLGLRWDFSPGMAVKLEWSHLRGEPGKRSHFNILQPTDFDYRANLVQAALEWVF